MKKSKERKSTKKLELKGRVKNNKAITLIALIVTIIVLLILAGVSIATLTGDNGLLTKAQQAKEENEKASDRDLIAMAVSEAQIGNNGYQELDESNFQKVLENQFKGRKVEAIANGDGSFNINLDNVSNMYYIDNDSQIIDKADMIAIGTADELKAFRDDVNNGNTYEGKYVYLTNNITLDISEEWTPIGLYPVDSTGPTDEERNKPFKGTFDGNNYTINGIYINTTNKGQGLFGIVYGGNIKNVKIGSENHFKVGNASSALVGYLYNSDIYNSINESEISSNSSYIGAIAGFVEKDSKIEKCSNTGNITIFENTSEGITIGGIIGQLMNSKILKCINTGTIQAKDNVGGICGYSSSSKIEECVNNGIINSFNTFSGGISGLIRNTEIESSYNMTNITSNSWWAGGITSLAYEICKIKNCYNVGNVVGTQMVSGVCKADTDGILEMSNCYYLENTINGTNETDKVEGVTSKTSEELKNLSEILGKSFKNDINNINNGYPILQWQ